jgi:hypothetical protein
MVRGNPGPDLTNRGSSYDNFSPVEAVPGGTNITIWCDVSNIGDAASGAFNVSFRLSTNTVISVADLEIAKVSVASISAGGYADVSWYGTFPVSVLNNTYYIGWIIDIDNDVVEDNEGNNVAYETVSQLDVIYEAELYNRGGHDEFLYSGFTPDEVMPTVTQFTIWCDIENVGMKPSGAFNVSFRASVNPIISVIDEEIARVTVPSIMNGSYADVSWTGTFPIIPINWYFVGWVIDVDNDVEEGDEDDYGIAEVAPLKVVNKSDLVDRGASYSGMNVTSVVPGVSSFNVFADIENIGITSSVSCNVSFYASLDTNITTSDLYIGSDTLAPLLNGSFGNVEWSGIFPNITAGTYYIGWIIDVNNDDDEGNENNNKAYISTQLHVGPPISPPGIPGYDLFLIIGIISIVSIIYLVPKLKRK